MKDLYQLLGVDKSATQEEIKKAYRTLSKKHHPDVGGEAKAFQEINLAHEVLSNPEMRAKYDRGEPVFNTKDPEAFARDRALQVFSALIENGQFDFKHSHVFKHLINNIRATINQLPSMKANALNAVTHFENIQKRIKGENSQIFINILEDKIRAAKLNASLLDGEAPKLEKIIAFLEKADYEVDERTPFIAMRFSATTSGTL